MYPILKPVKFSSYLIHLALLFIFSLPTAQAKVFTLKNSEIKYTVKHLTHNVHGNSTAAKGKGKCDSKWNCNFLLATPIKSFESGDSNRDSNVFSTMRAAAHPMAITKIKTKGKSKQWFAEVELRLAGKQKLYKNIKLEYSKRNSKQIKGSAKFSFLLSDFDIEAPQLLLVAVEDAVELRVDFEWKD